MKWIKCRNDTRDTGRERFGMEEDVREAGGCQNSVGGRKKTRKVGLTVVDK